MKCPNCNFEFEGNDNICPNCFTNCIVKKVKVVKTNTVTVPTNVAPSVSNDEYIKVPTEDADNNNIEEEKEHVNFLLIIIVVISLILLGIFVLLYLDVIKPKKDNNISVTTSTTSENKGINNKNQGVSLSMGETAEIGSIVIASYYDEVNKKKTNVDITANRYIVGSELDELVLNYGQNHDLYNGFTWYGIEYTIKFNNLDYLKDPIKPLISTYVLNDELNRFVIIGGEKMVKPDVVTISDNTLINNGESSTIRVIYQSPPDQKTIICFGEYKSSMGCFNRE